jgi:hypothetical protein
LLEENLKEVAVLEKLYEEIIKKDVDEESMCALITGNSDERKATDSCALSNDAWSPFEAEARLNVI